MRSGLIAVVFLAVAVTLAGCGNAELDEVRNDQMQIRGMIASQNQEIEKLQGQIRLQQDRMEEMGHASSDGGEAGDQISSLKERLSKLESTVSTMQSGAGTAPPTVEGEGTPGSISPPPVSAPAVGTAPSAALGWQSDLSKEIAASPSGPGAKIYRAGLDAMRDGQYDAAVARFSQLQKRYPKSPLTEPGEYFLANALYESGKYDQSIIQFSDLVMRYPKGRFASSGLLREAEAFLKINDKIDARLTLQKLLADHADSPEAAPANDIMKDLQS